MLRVRVELVPFGQEDLVAQIGCLLIGNDASGDEEVGNYDVAYRQGDPDNVTAEILTERDWEWTHARVEGHERDQGLLPLVEAAVQAVRQVHLDAENQSAIDDGQTNSEPEQARSEQEIVAEIRRVLR